MRKSILLNTFGNIFYSLCQWLITIIIVYVENYEYGSAGILSLAMTTSSSFSAISMFSMRSYQISDAKREFSSGQYFSSRIITCAVALIACTVAAIPGNTPFQTLCIILFMLIRVAEGFADVLFGIDQMHDRYGLICVSCVLRGCATVAGFIGGMILTHNLLVTLIVMAALNLLVVLLVDIKRTFSIESVRIRLKDPELIKLYRRCLPIVAYTFLLGLVNTIPRTALQRTSGDDILGIYSSIASPTLIVQVFASVAFAPIIPKLADFLEKKDYRSFSKILRLSYLALIGLAAVALIGAALIGRIGLVLLFKEDILEYYGLFMPIVMCTILLACIWILQTIAVTIRRLNTLLIGMIVDFVILCLVTYPCIERFGINGTSYAQIIVYSLMIPFIIVICEYDIAKRKRLAGSGR